MSGPVHASSGIAGSQHTRSVAAHAGPRVPLPSSTKTVNIVFTVADENFAHGTFGIVFEGILKPSNEKVAIKKVLQDPQYRNRELECIKALNHPNVVELKYHFFETVGNDKFLYLIMEYMPHSLYRVIRRLNSRKRYTPMIYVRVVMFQLFRALAYIHSLKICHRDVKPHNILLDPRSAVTKLCDFGSAKQLVPGETNVFYICSRFYRAPDLMLGRENYGFDVDMWSVGCVMGEMINNSVLFLGDDRADQIAQIINILGTPTKNEVTAMNPEYLDLTLPDVPPKPWSAVFHRDVPDEALSLITDLLRYDPRDRVSAFEALNKEFFEPLRDSSSMLPGEQPLPTLFDWTSQELSHMPPRLKSRLVRNDLQGSSSSPRRAPPNGKRASWGNEE